MQKKNYKIKQNATTLRNNLTLWERKLWFCFLKNYKYNFKRQYIVDSFILDFYCPKIKLAIELDGSQHFEPDKILYDKNRTKKLNELGIMVIRINNIDVDKKFDDVCVYIDSVVNNLM